MSEFRIPFNRPSVAGRELDYLREAHNMELFRGRFEIDEVKLVRPHLVLSPTEATPQETPGGEPGDGSIVEPAATVSLALAALSVEDGTVELSKIGVSGNPSFIHDGRDQATFVDGGEEYPLDKVAHTPWSEVPFTEAQR